MRDGARPKETIPTIAAKATEAAPVHMIAIIDALPTTIPPMAAPAAKPNWIKVLFRLSMIPDASGASETRLKFRVGPHIQAAMAQIINNETVAITDPEKTGIIISAMACTIIPPTKVRAAPIRSAKKPPSLDPTKLATPNKRRMTLMRDSIDGITDRRKGVVYELTIE